MYSDCKCDHQNGESDWPIKNDFTLIRRHGFALFIMFILLITIYGNSFDCSWHLDDYSNIVDNSNIHITSLSWNELEKSLYGIVDTGRWSRPV